MTVTPGQAVGVSLGVSLGVTLAAGDRAVLVACSGGPDSVALAHLLCDAGVRVTALAHVDHGLRESSDGELVRALAARLGIPFVERHVRVERRGSLEEAARRARWAALRELEGEAATDLIATGHTADDQAETVLMRLSRGAGLTGAVGMRPLAAGVWRPLLDVRRSALRALCCERRWDFVDDPTNDDRRFERNRIRLDVLPLLGDRAVPALVRVARLAADDDDLLERLAAEAPLEEREEGAVAVPIAWLETAHPALGRRAIRRAARIAGAGYLPTYDRIEDARSGRAVSMGGGVSSRREGAALVICVARPSTGGEPAS